MLYIDTVCTLLHFCYQCILDRVNNRYFHVSLQVKVMQIPPGATGLVQPFDVYGFRPLKNFIRHIEDYVMLHSIDVVISQRNNTLKLISLILDQFESPRYVAFWRYSWYKAGLIDERPDHFDNPVQFGFATLALICSRCENLNMIKCSWCKDILCFQHFFTEYHVCRTYIM